ncbi:hypothetical protein HK107_09455 [Parvularcula sp. ZS-1/3]|uniref:Uncharacterized protein n=1 Tax=Parvularcula mediterranea TaxID=2732508 RepID=A0A7Y3RMW0_9PROT|nr:hypothetical protein [Parvularcula mediterranea]NNU16545.1 hypothetical protein [Parvularcula mediterranea]
MELPGRFAFLCALAAGTFALAVMTLLGALWPEAPSDEARAELAFALTKSGLAFFAAIMLLTGKLIAERIDAPGDVLRAFDIGSALVFAGGFFGAGIKINFALNHWFEVPPTMGGGDIAFIRLLVLTPFFALLITCAAAVAVLLRRRFRRR